MSLLEFITTVLIAVESGWDNFAIGAAGEVGCLQISEIAVADCNRIVGESRFFLTNRFDRVESVRMACLYLSHYEPDGGPEQWAKCWNGGPGWRQAGPAKAARLEAYWTKCRDVMGEAQAYRSKMKRIDSAGAPLPHTADLESK